MSDVAWRIVRLGAVAKVRSGHAFSSASWRRSGMPVVRIANVREGRIDLADCVYVDEETADSASEFYLKPGEIVITMTGRIGEVARVPATPKMLLNQRVGRLTIDQDQVDSRYLLYWLRQPRVRTEMELHAYGVAQPNISPTLIEGRSLRLPPIQLQRKIAAALSAYDELMENNLRRIAILEEIAKATFREWFVNLRYPGDLSYEAWPEVQLSELVTTQYGYTASTNEVPVGPKFLRGMDFNKRPWVDWSQVPYCEIAPDLLSKYRLHDLDILVIRMADPGKVAIIEGEHDAVFASYLVRITPDLKFLEPYWLFYYLSSPDYQAYIGGAGTGTTRSSASAGVLTGPQLRVPPMHLQQAFVAVVSPLRALLNNLLSQNANLRTTRDLLLPKLVSGAIDVSDLDIDSDWLVA